MLITLLLVQQAVSHLVSNTLTQSTLWDSFETYTERIPYSAIYYSRV